MSEERIYSANGITLAIIYWILAGVIIIPAFLRINIIVVILTIIGCFVAPFLAADYDLKREKRSNKG